MRIDIEQLEFIDKKLRSMLLMLEAQFDVEFTITSLYRIGDNGVHGQLPLRGIDLRCQDEHLGRLVEDYINSIWEYDHGRDLKCCMYHDAGSGDHLHFQVHPNTRLV